MKQESLFEDEFEQQEQKYTSKVKIPICEPKNKKPHPLELYDSTKTSRLINEIQNAEIDDDEKKFLIEAARRHTVFNYSKIADFYAHSKPEVQRLMEKSALVIIDFDKAISYGYVRLSQEVANQYFKDYGDE
jgi:hypothetical protein